MSLIFSVSRKHVSAFLTRVKQKNSCHNCVILLRGNLASAPDWCCNIWHTQPLSLSMILYSSPSLCTKSWLIICMFSPSPHSIPFSSSFLPSDFCLPLSVSSLSFSFSFPSLLSFHNPTAFFHIFILQIPYCTCLHPNMISLLLSLCRHVFLVFYSTSHNPGIIWCLSSPPSWSLSSSPPSTFDPFLPLLCPPLIPLFHTSMCCDPCAPLSCEACPCVWVACAGACMCGGPGAGMTQPCWNEREQSLGVPLQMHY